MEVDSNEDLQALDQGSIYIFVKFIFQLFNYIIIIFNIDQNHQSMNTNF